MKNNLRIIASIIPISIFINSCGTDENLVKVREFSSNADLVQQALPVIADDFYDSCLRAARYKAVDLLPSDIEKDNSVIDDNAMITEEIKKLKDQVSQEAPDSEIEKEIEKLEIQLLKLPSVFNRLQARVNAQKKCNEKVVFKGLDEEQIASIYLSSLMKNGNNIIALYMKKLGVIASDNLIGFDNEFNNLSSNFKGLQTQLSNLLGFGVAPEKSQEINEKAKAGFNLANFILNQIFENRRIDTLEDAITTANMPLTNYAEGLQSVVERVYIENYLRIEETQLDNYYIDYIEEILDSKERLKGDSVISIANTLINIDQDRWNPKKDKIQERRDLAYSYINLIETVVDGHNELAKIYNGGRQPSQEDIGKVIDSNSKAMKDFVDKAKALRKSSEVKSQ